MKFAVDLTRLNRNNSGLERFAMMITYNMVKNSDDEFCLLFKKEVYPLFEEFRDEKRISFTVIENSSRLLFDLITLPYQMGKIKADKYLFLAFPVPILFFRKNTVCAIHDLGCWDCPDTMTKKFLIYFRVALRLSALKCKTIITVSEFTQRRIVEKLKCRPDRIHIIYNAADEHFFAYESDGDAMERVREKYKLPDEYILCLSVIQPRKNMELLLGACSELWKENRLRTPLVIAGKSGWKNSELINTQNDRLHFTGYIDDCDLPLVYHMAKAFVFPSLYEGFGIPPLEAMAASTPVISSDGPCMPEILKDAPLYFKNNDKNDLKEKILSMNSVDTEEMIKKGNAVAKSYDWKSQACKLLRLLKDNEDD